MSAFAILKILRQRCTDIIRRGGLGLLPTSQCLRILPLPRYIEGKAMTIATGGSHMTPASPASTTVQEQYILLAITVGGQTALQVFIGQQIETDILLRDMGNL
jgi:hypothetical protein